MSLMYEAQTIAFMAPPFNLDDACLEALSQAFVQAGCASPSQVESWRTECQPELMTCEFCKKHERTCVCSADKIVCESCTGSKRSCTFKNSFTLWLLKPWTQEQFDQLLDFRRQRGGALRTQRELENTLSSPPLEINMDDINPIASRVRRSSAGNRSVSVPPPTRKRKGETSRNSPAKHPRRSTPPPPPSPSISFAPVTVVIDDVPITAHTQAELDSLVTGALQHHGIDLRHEVEELTQRLALVEAERMRLKEQLVSWEKRVPSGEDFQSRIVELQGLLREAKQEAVMERAKLYALQNATEAVEQRAKTAEGLLTATATKMKELEQSTWNAERELETCKLQIGEYASRTEAAEKRANEAESRCFDMLPCDSKRVDDVLGCLQVLRHHLDPSALPTLFDILQDISSAKNDRLYIDKGIQRWIPSLWTVVLTQTSLAPETKEIVVKCLTEMSAKVIL